MTSISTPMVISPSSPLDAKSRDQQLPSSRWLATTLRQGAPDFTRKVVGADHGAEIADAALREIGGEL